MIAFLPSVVYNALFLISLIVLLLSGFIKHEKTISKRVFREYGAWILLAIYIILHKSEAASYFSIALLTTCGCIFMGISITKTSFRISNRVISQMLFYSKIHIIATIIVRALPSVYEATLLKVFDPVTQTSLKEYLSSGRIAGITSHPSQNGIYLAISMILFCSLYFIYDRKDRKTKVWLVLSVVALLICGKRAHAVFAVFAVIAMYFYYVNEAKFSKFIKIVIGVLVGLVGVVILANYVPAINSTIVRIIDLFSETDKTGGRQYFYAYALSWFNTNPIFGIGWEGFKYSLNAAAGAYLGRYEYMSAHNVYLQVMCELGIIGLIIFVLQMFLDFGRLLSKKNWKRMADKEDRFYIAVACCIHLFFVLYCITGNALFDPEIMIPYMVLMGFANNVINRPKTREDEK